MGDASRVVLDITVSLDGFVARTDGDVSRLHEWLFSGVKPSGNNDFFSLSPRERKGVRRARGNDRLDPHR